ncbi:hypothetical protein BB560_003963 [Smittium megazygosporum]|uniref:Hyaluronan/mRNA-binding protein domain-containing protein n=1 Tax=Smittium megazygosporum TaxID=133381 RepID=A0A2T9ZAK7_9FUNG|nr:hypothetical protein BB560_003963 [Smittium megazygosporum]
MAESVASRNIFDLLKDDVPDAEVSFNISKTEPANKAKAPVKQASKPAASGAQKTERGSGSSRGQRRGAARSAGGEGRAPRGFVRDSTPGDRDGSDRPRGSSRGRPRPQGDSRRGRNAGAPSGGRRQFDRHSGTGLVDSEKKTKQGWLGDDEAVVKEGEEAEKQAVNDNAEETSEAPVPEEPVDNTKTLQEYLKEKMEKLQVASADKNIRKPNEGTDKSLLKSSKVILKEVEQFFIGKPATKAKKQPKVQREKVRVVLDTKFIPLEESHRRRDRPERGGRQGARRGKAPSAPRLNSDRDFPSLG